MISIKLTGGLGNQMFIYAFAKAIEQKGFSVCLSACEYSLPKDEGSCLAQQELQSDEKDSIEHIRNLEIQSFNLSLPLKFGFEEKFRENSRSSRLMGVARYLCDRFKPNHYPSNPRLFFALKSIVRSLCHYSCLKFGKVFYEFDPVFCNKDLLSLIEPDFHLLGYFQDLQYFRDIQEILIRDFKLQRPLSAHNQVLRENIIKTPNSCFLHIRRGDYLIEEHWQFVELGSTYYENAIREMKRRIKNPNFFIFSNEIAWCKENFLKSLSVEVLDGANFYFVDQNGEGNAVEEMELMRACKNGIIANSTFSWWGAYLIENPSKVIISPTHFHYYESIVSKLIPIENENGEWIAMNFTWKEEAEH